MSDEAGTAGDDVLVANETADTLNGLDGNDLLFGRGGADRLYGGAGNDALYGEGGLDTMYGGPGDDAYFVDNPNLVSGGDIVWEASGEGLDTVYTSVSYSLYHAPGDGGEIERLGALDRLATTPLQLTGNSFDNEIWGNAGNNTLEGREGRDILRGGPGDDWYWAVVNGDQVVESAGEGYDTVEVRSSYTLPDNIERLYYSGGAPARFIGNALDNVIELSDGGRVGSRLLVDGGPGADVMMSTWLDDIFVVDDPGDVILSAPSLYPGFFPYDTIYSTVDFALAYDQWRVVATIRSATSELRFTGNAQLNEITGNNGDNVLDGGAGADILTGFLGADTFRFTSPLGGGNVDQVATFEPGVDRIALAAAVFAGLPLGPLDPAAFNTGPAASQADDRILYDSASGNLYFDVDGSGAAAAQQFAVLHEGLNLTAADFVVI